MCYTRLLKPAKADQAITMHTTIIQPVLEYAAQVWHHIYSYLP